MIRTILRRLAPAMVLGSLLVAPVAMANPIDEVRQSGATETEVPQSGYEIVEEADVEEPVLRPPDVTEEDEEEGVAESQDIDDGRADLFAPWDFGGLDVKFNALGLGVLPSSTAYINVGWVNLNDNKPVFGQEYCVAVRVLDEDSAPVVAGETLGDEWTTSSSFAMAPSSCFTVNSDEEWEYITERLRTYAYQLVMNHPTTTLEWTQAVRVNGELKAVGSEPLEGVRGTLTFDSPANGLCYEGDSGYMPTLKWDIEEIQPKQDACLVQESDDYEVSITLAPDESSVDWSDITEQDREDGNYSSAPKTFVYRVVPEGTDFNPALPLGPEWQKVVVEYNSEPQELTFKVDGPGEYVVESFPAYCDGDTCVVAGVIELNDDPESLQMYVCTPQVMTKIPVTVEELPLCSVPTEPGKPTEPTKPVEPSEPTPSKPALEETGAEGILPLTISGLGLLAMGASALYRARRV